MEAVIKIVAMGFIMEQGCYLREAWNWLDFIVVITALLSSLPGMNNVSGLRTFRLFRPLRSLTSLSSMQDLVETLLSSVGQLGNILALAMFFFGIFAILGISLWSGLLHFRCRETPFPVDGDWVRVESDERVCGSLHQCTVACGSLYEAYDEGLNITVPLSRDSSVESLNWGITNFDNIGSAFLTIFQCITLEGWTDVMYMIEDAYSVWVAALYFCLCIVVCSYFLMNLTVAVMLDEFQNLNKKNDSNYDKFIEENYKVKGAELEHVKKKLRDKRNKSIAEKKSPKRMTGREMLLQVYQTLIYKPIDPPDEEDNYYSFKVTRICYYVIMMQWFQTLIMLLIVVNTIILSLDRFPLMDP